MYRSLYLNISTCVFPSIVDQPAFSAQVSGCRCAITQLRRDTSQCIQQLDSGGQKEAPRYNSFSACTLYEQQLAVGTSLCT